MGQPLEGKVALVTGSCIGLGAAVVRRFSQDGAQVVVTGFPVERGRALAAELKGASFVAADLRDAGEARRLVETTLARHGGLDILVNNAAVSPRATLEEFSPEHFDEVMHVNVRSILLLAQAARASLVERRGVIVNIGSVNAYVGWQNLLVYAASKGAIVTLSRNLANALKYARVRVHCLNPGWVDTEGERGAMRALGHADDYLVREGERLPMQRLLTPEEVAEAVAFFVSPQAEAFSGSVVDLEQFPLGALHHPRHTEPMQ